MNLNSKTIDIFAELEFELELEKIKLENLNSDLNPDWKSAAQKRKRKNF